jgi:predicted nucleic acid-binding protein
MTRAAHLVDTNVLCELPKLRPSAAVLEWLGAQREIAISAVTLEELTFGAERTKGAARERLRGWLRALLDTAPRVIPVTALVATTAGRLRAQREAKGRPVAQADMLVAACALTEGLVLATRKVKDFEGCGVMLVNPFE